MPPLEVGTGTVMLTWCCVVRQQDLWNADIPGHLALAENVSCMLQQWQILSINNKNVSSLKAPTESRS